jgi:LmbE family N-acetylglucosaminyl deacetylase
MNVLVVAPHPDDEAIGCGGALCLHAMRGDRVTAVFLTSGELGLKHLPQEEAWRVRESEAEEAALVLGLSRWTFLRCPDWLLGEHIAEAAARVQKVLVDEQPDLLYLPHSGESHPDHQVALPIVRAALCSYRHPSDLFLYEVWTPLSQYDQVKDISAVMERKLAAIRCYGSQLGSYQYERAARGLNEYRGALGGHCPYAEVFRHEDTFSGGQAASI